MDTAYTNSVEFIKDVRIDGNLQLASGSSIVTDEIDTLKIKTDVIQPATPNGDISVIINGIGNTFDIQLTGGIKLPFGGSNLTWYQEYMSVGNQWSGITVIPIGGDYTIGRVGGFCCVRLPFVTGVATIAGYLSSTIPLPSWALPTVDVIGPIAILDNASQLVGFFNLDHITGIITISSPTGTFSGAGLSGFPASVCFSYALM